MNRSGQGPQHPGVQSHSAPQPVVSAVAEKRLRDKSYGKFSIFMLVLIGVTIALLTAYIATLQNKSEGSFIDGNRFQAVFLNGGQVYFGKIRDLNSRFITLDNIYYLQTNETTDKNGKPTAVSPTLAKLGCELHAPEDKMVINREQVQFWENLKDEKQSKVAYAIQEYVKKYPNGETCTDPAQAASATPATNNNTTPTQQTPTQSTPAP